MEAGLESFEVVLFDFFGTLVSYEPDRRRLGYPDTHRLVRSWGYKSGYDAFVAEWDASSAAFEVRSAGSLEEHSMLDIAAAFAVRAGLKLSRERREAVATAFLTEWQRGVRPVVGVTDLICGLSHRYRLGVVSNTHDGDMVPSLLRSIGVADFFEVVVLSVDHGYRKPHPSIYDLALERLSARAADVVFVGDSYEADYAGPQRAGMAAFLIDPDAHHEIPSGARLGSVLDLSTRLAR